MRVEFKKYTDLAEVLKFNKGIKPYYGKGTMKGAIWCSCNCCTGNLLLLKNNKVVGFLDTECSVCGKQINYSEAEKYL